MLRNLSSTTGSALNITSEATVDTYTAGEDGWLAGAIKLSNLNGAAATLTVKVQRLDASNNKLGVPVAYSVAKDAAADTTAALTLPPMRILSGEKYRVRLASTNASDTSVTWSLAVDDAIAADVRYVGGTAQTARDIGAAVPAASPGAAGGLLIAGSNAATTFATLTATGAFTINGTSHVSQTGDSYSRIGAAGAGLTAVVLADASLTTAKLGTFVLAKTTNISGFNDIAATAIVSAGAITTNSGAVVTVTNLTNAPTSGLTAQETRDALKLAPSAGSPAAGSVDALLASMPADTVEAIKNSSDIAGVDDIDATLTASHGAGPWGDTSSGTGPFAVTVTVVNAGNPVPGVAVRLTGGPTVTGALFTDADGEATFGVIDGTYTIVAIKAGYESYAGSLTVDADEFPIVTFTALSPTGVLSMTLDDARELVRGMARNAGEDVYSDVEVDRCIIIAGQEFVRLTQSTNRTDSIVLAEDDISVDVGIDRLRPEYVVSASLEDSDGKVSRVEVTNLSSINRDRATNADSGLPTAIAFSDASTIELYPTVSEACTLKLQWTPPFPTWIPGTEDTVDLSMLAYEILLPIMAHGAVFYLTRNEPQNAGLNIAAKAGFDTAIKAHATSGSLGAQTVSASTRAR